MLEKGSRDLCGLSATEWTPLPKPLVIDSGAGETVIPIERLPNHPTRESEGSRNDEYYATADGTRIYNEGATTVTVATLDKKVCRGMTFQVAGVHKALGSVSQMVRNGNRVVFDQDGAGRDISYIQHRATQEKIPIRLENGVYVLDLLVAPASQSGTTSVVTRRGS